MYMYGELSTIVWVGRGWMVPSVKEVSFDRYGIIRFGAADVVSTVREEGGEPRKWIHLHRWANRVDKSAKCSSCAELMWDNGLLWTYLPTYRTNRSNKRIGSDITYQNTELWKMGPNCLKEYMCNCYAISIYTTCQHNCTSKSTLTFLLNIFSLRLLTGLCTPQMTFIFFSFHKI